MTASPMSSDGEPSGRRPRGGGADQAPAPRSIGRHLPTAIAVGVTLAVLCIGTILLHPFAFLGLVAVLVIIGLLELDRVFVARGLRPATPIAVGAGLVLLFGAYASGPSGQSVGLVLLVLGTLVWTLLDPNRTQVAHSLGATFFMALWVPLMASFIGLLLARDNGTWYVLGTVALTVTNDIGAFAWGHAFGAHKLAPSVSPAKTWEGFAGGVVTVLLVAGLAAAWLPGFDLLTALVLGLGVAVAATLGDLAESLVKRDLGVKDLGAVLPGHGGVMDRVDAMLFALPTAHLLLLVLGH